MRLYSGTQLPGDPSPGVRPVSWEREKMVVNCTWIFKLMPESDMWHSTHMSLDKASHMAASNYKSLGSATVPRVWENQTRFVGRTVPDDNSCYEEKNAR